MGVGSFEWSLPQLKIRYRGELVAERHVVARSP
jgi:hypothetical protein